MAIAFVNSGSTSVSAASITLTYSSTVGNFLVLMMASSGAIQLATAIVDSAGNNWVLVSSNSTTTNVAIYVTESTSPLAITSVGLSGLTNTSHELMIAEYSGVTDWRILNSSANATSTTASISSTLFSANNWLVATASHTGTSGGVFTAATGNIRVQQASVAARRNAILDNTAASAISVTCSATLVSQPWTMSVIEMCAAASLNIVNLTNSSTNASQTTYTSASITPTSGDLILVACTVTSVTPAAFNKIGYPIITGAGLTFNTVSGAGDPNNTRRMWFAYANADGAATAGALTFTFGVAPQNSFAWSVERVRGHDASSAIAWCVQMVLEFSSPATIHNPTANLDTLQDANSLCYGASFTALSIAQWGPGAGWTSLMENGAFLSTESKVNDPVVTWTNTGTTTVDLIIAVEITASNANTHLNPLAQHLLAGVGCGK